MCPKCRGTARREIAPGYFACTSKAVVDVMIGSGVPVEGMCGHRYQEAPRNSGFPQCRCGMFAVKSCQQCGQVLCGDHGSLYGKRWFCDSCRSDLRVAELDRAEQARAAKKVEYYGLPTVPEDVLAQWLVGDVPESAFIDGVTHNAVGWTCADVFDLIHEVYELPGEGVSVGGGARLRPNGIWRPNGEYGDGRGIAWQLVHEANCDFNRAYSETLGPSDDAAEVDLTRFKSARAGVAPARAEVRRLERHFAERERQERARTRQAWLRALPFILFMAAIMIIPAVIMLVGGML